jgi:hypothetical protein
VLTAFGEKVENIPVAITRVPGMTLFVRFLPVKSQPVSHTKTAPAMLQMQ